METYGRKAARRRAPILHIRNVIFVEVKWTSRLYVRPYRFAENAPWFDQLDRMSRSKNPELAREATKVKEASSRYTVYLKAQLEKGAITYDEYGALIQGRKGFFQNLKVGVSTRYGFSVATMKRFVRERITAIGIDTEGSMRSTGLWRLLRWTRDDNNGVE